MRKLIDSRMIGKSIKSLREARHLTQSEMANLVFYSERNIRRIENNGTSNLDVVNRFAEVFDVSAIDILNGCFLFAKNKKNIGSFHHTMLTLICYSYTRTLGRAISCDLLATSRDINRTVEGTILSFNFQRASANKFHISGIPLSAFFYLCLSN